MPRSLMLLLPAAGCVLPTDVGDACGPVQVVEVMTAGEFLDQPLVWSGQKMDFLELQNLADEGEPVDLEGYLIRLYGSSVENPLPSLELEPGGRALLVASTYELQTEGGEPIRQFRHHPEEPRIPYTGVLMDMNNDASEIEVESPSGESCQLLALPDQHAGWSWSAQLEAGEDITWCRATPTPGHENAPCRDR